MKWHLLALEVLFWFASLTAHSQTIHLNVIDGITGHALTDLYIQVALFNDGDRTGRRSVFAVGLAGVDVITEGAQYIEVTGLGSNQIHLDEYGECEQNSCKFGRGFRSARVAEVLTTGISSEHARTSAKTALRPGVLDLYVRQISWFQRLVDRFYS